MKAVVTAEWAGDGLERLGYQVQRAGWGVTGHALDRADLIAAAGGAALLVVEVERVDAAVLSILRELRMVASARGVPSNVDLAACTQRGIPVLHAPARNAASVADFTMGLILAECRGIARSQTHLRQRGWLVGDTVPYLRFRGPELAGRTLGVVGYGAVGRAVAQRARAGFAMQVIFHDPYVEGSVALDELLRGSDVVSLHCVRSPDTTGLIGTRELALMKPTAYLVNTAGGGVVDEAALVAVLRDRRIAGAALDVYADEPLRRDSPLLALDNVTLTPHLAGAADDVPTHHARMICADVARWLAGERPLHLANPAVWPAATS